MVHLSSASLVAAFAPAAFASTPAPTMYALLQLLRLDFNIFFNLI